jgi:hypothetical protein
MKWEENDLNDYYFNDNNNNESIFFDRENNNYDENINLNNFILTNSQYSNDFIKDDYYSNNNNEEINFNNIANDKIHINNINEKNEKNEKNNNSLNNNNNDLSTIGNSNQNNNTNSIETNEFFPNDFKNLSLKERMKYKIDKTKKMLEKKTNRNNNEKIPLKEEINKNSKNNNKISKNNNLNINEIDKNNLSKKELKMLRNRLSAQRSRDRKKKEFDELKTLTQNLLTENEKLKNEILQKNSIINNLKNILKNLCPNCLDLIKNNNFISINTNNNNNNNSDESIPIISDNISTTSNNSSSSNRIGKLSLLTGLIALICIFGTIKLNNNNNIFKIEKVYNNNNRFFNPRNLITNFVEKSLNGNEYKQLTYDNKNNNDDSKNKQIQVPFDIQKNYEIRNKKNKEKNNTNLVPINYYNNEIDNNIKNYYKYVNKNLPTLFCNNLILENKFYKAEEFINNLFKNKENDKAISNLRIEKHPSISFKGKEDDMFIDLIIPINNCFNSTNEITNNCNSSSENEDYYKVSCKIFEITKNINK